MSLVSILLSIALAQGLFETKLIEAVNNESAAEVKKLAQDKSQLQKKDSAGYDALHHAVSINNSQIVKILLNAGASTNEVYGDQKESILFEATRLGSQDIVEKILSKNSKLLQTKNTANESVLFEAVRANNSKLAEFYIKKGLSLNDKNTAGKKPEDYLTSTNEKMSALLKKSAK